MIDWKTRLGKLAAEYDHVSRTVREERGKLREVLANHESVLGAQKLLQEAAEVVQAKAHRQIAAVVTRCLKVVFGDDGYEFRIHFDKKRGKTEARLTFVRGGLEVDPTEAAGGGAVDVAAFALRLACLVLSHPRRRGFLCLDEPFRFVSREYRPAVRSLVEVLAEELDIQFLIVTHSPEFQIGRVVELT